MLSPLFFFIRVPTLLARFWRALVFEKADSGLPYRSRMRVIIFRLDAMGDVVMTTPLFRELKRSYPNSHCTVAVQHAFRPLLVTNPYIDEILTLPEISPRWLPRHARKPIAAMLFYWRYLRGRRYDIAISPRWDLDEHLATLLCLLANVPERVGYTEKASPMKHRLNRGFDRAFSTCLAAGPVQHEVMRNLAIVNRLGGTVHDSRLEVRLTERDRELASRLLEGVPASTKVIALGIGANSSGRRWPISRYADAVSQLAAQTRVQPVIVCSALECEPALKLAQLLTDEAIILAGTPLRVACAVLERCDLFIGNDSGTAHLAAAMNCKTIVISRHPRDGDPNHSNSPLRFAPYCQEARVLQPATGLEACTDSCRVTAPHCIEGILVEDVVSAAQAMWCGKPATAELREQEALLNCQHEYEPYIDCHHERSEGSACCR